MQQHDGWIQVATQHGQGSTFKVFLPACDETIGENSAAETVSQNSTCGAGEAVLLVEDEPLVPGGRSLSKPYDPLTLLRTVKLSLDEKGRLSAAETALSEA